MTEKQKIRKTQLLEIAQNHFSSFGYKRTSLLEIAQALNMRKSSLYYYFESKQDLFAQCYLNDWEEHKKLAESKSNEIEALDEKILFFVEQQLNYYQKLVEENKLSPKILLEVREFLNQEYNEVQEEKINFIAQIIFLGTANDFFETREARRIAHLIIKIQELFLYRNFEQKLNPIIQTVDFKKIKSDVLFSVELLIKGIKK